MPGYPNKITRNSLGPTFINANKIGSPQEEADANIFNLMCWQLAGLNLCAPRALIIGQADNASILLISQYLSWDPNGLLGPTALSRSGTGAYVWTLPGTGIYPDMNGNSVPVNIEFVDARVNGGTNRYVIGEVDTDGNSGSMYCFLADTGAATDIGGAGVFKRFALILY